MRLVCPNCDAKYEVPDDAIPDTGRDVQCANCGHAWFQMRARPAGSAGAAPEAAPEASPVAAMVAEPDPTAELTLTPGADPEPAASAAPEPDTVDAPADESPEVTAETAPIAGAPEPDLEADAPESVPADADVDAAGAEYDVEADTTPEPEAILAAGEASTAYGVDDSVLAILREEAEREANARRAEARSLETQTDLGLDALPAVSTTAADPQADPEPDAKPAARRDLLPDVEEINSTLRPSESDDADPSDAYAAAPLAQRSPGFRGGFVTVMVVAVLAAAVYLAAPQISGQVPALEGPLDAYVGQIDGLRLALDGMMRSATVAINGS